MNSSSQTAWHPPGEDNSENGFFASIRRSGWNRRDPRWVGGVCSGFAYKTGWDVSLVRGVVVVLSLFFGFPAVLYALAWLLLPDARNGKIEAEEALAGRFDATQLLAGLLLLFSVINPFMWGAAVNAPWYALGGIAIVGVAIAIAAGARRSSTASPKKGSSMPYQEQRRQYPTPPPGAPFPPPNPNYSPASPALPSAVGLTVIGLLLLLGAAMAASNVMGYAYFPWFAIWCAVALLALGVTLGIGALTGRRGGWLFGLSIAFAIIAAPLSFALASNYQHSGTALESEVFVESETTIDDDLNPQLESGDFQLDATVESFDATSSMVTLDLTGIADLKDVDKVIEGNIESSVLTIKVDPKQPFSYDINGAMSRLSTSGSDIPDWLPVSATGDISAQNELENSLQLNITADVAFINFEVVK